MLSVIIPALNAADKLSAAVAALAEGRVSGLVVEVIVADGGSSDDTRAVDKELRARVVESARGRGEQMIAGADKARGGWLLFLHADSVLEAGWADAFRDFITAHGEGKAAVFRFALDDGAGLARMIERGVALRGKLLGLPYGDQGLVISRRLYRDIGGFAPLPLMEDVDIVRRIKRRRLEFLPVRAWTSAQRYRREGYIPRAVRNVAITTAYFCGVPPRLLARLYG